MNTRFMAMLLIASVVVLLALLAVPVALIWSFNTLFPVLEIPYTVDTWAAALLISAALSARAYK